jgi:sigma-B regulation protein RsbU (phosphoserine phosphatase)
MFVTLLLMQLIGDGGAIRVANAGNNRPLLYRSAADEIVDFGTTGLPLAIDPAFPYTMQEHVLQRGDFLLLYTDGLTDATDSRRDLFGRERLLAALWEVRRSPADEIRQRLRLAVAAFIGATPRTMT